MEWKLSDPAAVGCIFVAAIVEATEEALKRSPHVVAKMPEFLTTGLWAFVPLALVVVATILFVVRYVLPKHRKAPEGSAAEEWAKPLPIVFRRTFKNETVLVDGSDFVECQFDQVTLEYNGKRPFRFTNCAFSRAGYNLQSKNPIIQEVILLFTSTMPNAKLLDMRPPPSG
jgi:hypothetical protein